MGRATWGKGTETAVRAKARLDSRDGDMPSEPVHLGMITRIGFGL